jgi:hypothetical protein
MVLRRLSQPVSWVRSRPACFTGPTFKQGGTRATSSTRWGANPEAEIASMYNFTNRMSLACGMIPKDEYHALAR